MNAARHAKNDFISRYKVLIIAIVISLAWHLFFLSAVKVISSPLPKSAVKFSKVAFLGPILSKVSIDLRASPASRSMLETRYADMAGKMSVDGTANDGGGAIYHTFQSVPHQDKNISSIVDDSISDEKSEPEYPAE